MLQQLIREAVRQAREVDSEVSFRASYGGRGMYDRRCIGVVGSNSECQRVIAKSIVMLREKLKTVQLGSSEEEQDKVFEEAVMTLTEPCEDSMGRSVIFYWPELSAIDTSDEMPDVRDFGDFEEYQEALAEWKDAQEKV